MAAKKPASGKREWIWDYTDSWNHPQMQEAGFWGMTVFREVCRISGQFGLEGELPDSYMRPEFIARRLLTDAVTDVRDGVTAAVTAGLLLKESNFYQIDGWARRQPEMSKTDAERQKKSRENKKKQKLAADSHETSQSVTGVTGADVTVTLREERRGEEKREEDVPEQPAVVGTTHPTSQKPEAVEVDTQPQASPPASEPAAQPESPALKLVTPARVVRAPKPRAVVDELVVAGDLEAQRQERLKALGMELSSGSTWNIATTVKNMKPVLVQYGRTRLLAMHALFLRDERMRALHQGFPLWVFLQDAGKWAATAEKAPARAANGRPFDPDEPRC